MIGIGLIFLGIVIIMISIFAAVVLAFYYIVKNAVKNGILDAYDKIQDHIDKI